LVESLLNALRLSKTSVGFIFAELVTQRFFNLRMNINKGDSLTITLFIGALMTYKL
jgi:hypothetical protein